MGVLFPSCLLRASTWRPWRFQIPLCGSLPAHLRTWLGLELRVQGLVFKGKFMQENP